MPPPENAVAPPNAAADIRAEMITILFRQTKTAFFGNYAVSAFTTLVLWKHADQTALLAWLAATFILTSVRYGFVLRYLRHPPLPEIAPHWAWAYTASSCLSGMLWGSISVLFLSPQDPVTVLMVSIAIAGVVSGSVTSHSAFPPTYYAFAIPAALPFVVRAFMIGGTLFSVLGALTLIFLLVNFYYSRTIWQTIRSSVYLRFENLDLIRQLTQEKERAESASLAKSRFLAAASHDLRQPVHALGLFASSLRLLGQQAQPKQELVETLARQIQSSLKNLGNLLNSLLDISRLDAGIVEVKPAPLAIHDAFNALQNEIGPTAQGKKLQLRIRPSRLWVVADPVLLHRILANIAANAVRYTDRGRVLIGCRRQGEKVAIQVYDTGIGIAAHQLPHIFKEFYQVDDAARRQEQELGLGLGLAIVERCASLMDAQIKVDSSPGRGSVFSILLPRSAPRDARQSPGAETVAAEPHAVLAVLVIDDDQAILNAAHSLVTSWGHHAMVAHNIAEAIDVAERHHRIDLILADYRLGGGHTGQDAIHAVNNRLTKPAKAVIITGDTAPERIQEAMASGFQLLHKPLAPEVLLKIIEDTATARGSSLS